MSTVMPESNKLRKAVKWISEHLQENPNVKLMSLINKAAVKFDLTPQESEYLQRFYHIA
jgi:hypothetical protein